MILVAVAVTVVFTVIDVAWLPSSNVSLDPKNLSHLAKIAAVMLTLFAGRFLLYRLRNDDSRAAVVVRWLARRILLFVGACALILPFAFVMSVFTYLASATDRPLIDGMLAAMDTGLGFHWPSHLQAINNVPVLAMAMVLAYHSLAVQVLLLLISFSALNRPDKLWEFIAGIAVSLAITCGLMACFPAGGAYAYFQPALDTYGAFTHEAGVWHYSHLMKLRSGESFTFLISEVEGLVTFPSYHTAVGVLIIYAVRHTRVAFWPIAILNATMISATLPEGGHHLTDVIAGAVVAAVSIFAVRSAKASRQERFEPEQATTTL